MNSYSSEHMELEFSSRRMERTAELFKSLGDLTRLEILCHLLHGECQVGKLAESLSCSPSGVSHQLRLLRNLRLVRSRREGKKVFYSLDDDHVADIIKVALTHSEEDS